jgi:hypothetical protein
MRGFQSAGDVVVLQGGTLHWVRALSCSVNSSWNFGRFTLAQWTTAYERYDVNTTLSPPTQNMVSMHTLTVDLAKATLEALTGRQARRLKREGTQRPGDDEIDTPLMQLVLHRLKQIVKLDQSDVERILAAMDDDENDARKRARGSFHAEPVGSMVMHCEICYREIINSYLRCDTCEETNLNLGTVVVVTEGSDSSSAGGGGAASSVVGKTTSGGGGDEGASSYSRPVFFCSDCGVEHCTAADNHSVLALYKSPHGSLEVLKNEFETALRRRCDRVLLLQAHTQNTHG